MKSDISLTQLTDQLDLLEEQAASAIEDAKDFVCLEKIRVNLLGKKGQLSIVLGSMANLSNDERPVVGQRANALKKHLQDLLSQRVEGLKEKEMNDKLELETLDVTSIPTGTPFGQRNNYN